MILGDVGQILFADIQQTDLVEQLIVELKNGLSGRHTVLDDVDGGGYEIIRIDGLVLTLKEQKLLKVGLQLFTVVHLRWQSL